jgi:hypothetical protein
MAAGHHHGADPASATLLVCSLAPSSGVKTRSSRFGLFEHSPRALRSLPCHSK